MLMAIVTIGLLTHQNSLPDSPWLRPYTGPTSLGVDRSTLRGKVLCGYQGWQCADGDESGMGWYHYGRGPGFGPGNCVFELWPDVSELPANEKYPTPFHHEDGTVAYLPSADNKATVMRHFQWMKKYGLDGVFVQRFAVEMRSELHRDHFTKVLSSCREGANRYGRTYAVMYDLSGLPEGGTSIVREDWTDLQSKMHITEDPAYLHDKGKPIVAVWGLGFNDGRKYTLQEGLDLVRFLKSKGCSVMVGVPTYWRDKNRDCLNDPLVDRIVTEADIVSPWTVGRFGSSAAAKAYADQVAAKDLAWCQAHKVTYLPVVFPGFSWSNLKPGSQFDQIPRQKGAFLTAQYQAMLGIGATAVYQAMFDEIDEGTAIFKCTNDPPKGASKFLTYEGLPSDFYLRLVGAWSKRLRDTVKK